MKKGIFMLAAGMLTLGVAAAFDENEWFKSEIDLRTPEVKRAEEQWLKPPAAPYPFAKTGMKTMNGIPWPHIDGKPLRMVSRAIMNYQFNGNPTERLLREHGVKVFVLDVDCAQLQPPPGKGFTMADTTFEKFMQSVESLVKTVPDAKFIVRLWLTNVPPDYVERFPQAVMTGEDGGTDWGRSYGGNGHTRRTNFLDEWRLYTGEFLAKFIEKIGQSPYAPHVAGFYLAAMNSGEWWYFKGAGDVGWDYSPGRKELFRRYLALKYGPDHVKTLKERWKLNSAEEVYELPSLAERGRYPILPGSKVSEYNQILNLPISGAAAYFARIIKAKTGGKSLAGMEIHAYLNIFKNNGTIFLNRLLRTPEIDFLGGPPSYDERSLGNYAIERAALTSLQKHGKFWFSEEDIRPHTAYGMPSGAAGEPPATREDSLNVIRRQFAAGMLKGYPGYLMDFGINWFHDVHIARTVQACNNIFEVLTRQGKLNRKCRIALVSDQESQLYGNYFANPTLIRQKVFSRSGLDYDFYELEDFLVPGAADQYSLVFFLNLRSLGEVERQGIEKLKNNGRTLVFLHDPGALDLSGQAQDDPLKMGTLTGIRLAASSDFLKGPVRWEGGGLRALFPEAEIPVKDDSQTGETRLWRQVSLSDAAVGYKTGNVLSRFYGDDADSVVLARNADGKPVTLFRKYPGWTAVFSSSCLLPVELVRTLAQYAGTPSCCSGPDVVFSAGDAVAVHAISDGRRTITMPNPGPVVEMFSRRQVSDSKTFDYEFEFGETRLFVTGNVLPELEKIEKAETVEIIEFVKNNPAPDTASGFYRWQRVKRPEEFFGQRKVSHADRYGDFPLRVSAPQAYLVADASIGEPAQLKDIARALREGAEPERSANSASFNRLKGTYRLPRQWEAMATDRPFVYLQEIGIGEGQSGLAAFYLMHPENKKVRILFSHSGPAELWIDNRRTELPEEGGEVTLPGTCSLIMMKLTNTDGEDGFSIKFYEPEAKTERGKTLPNRLAAVGLKVRLAPPGYNVRLEKQVSPLELSGQWSNIDFAEGVGTMTKSASAVNQTRFEIDPEARYRIGASVCGKSGGNWFIGFVQYDADGKLIGTREVHYLPGTDTELAKPCSENDTVVYLKNAEKWQAMPNGCIAFQAQPDLKDLPNRNLSRNGIKKISREGDVWAVTLAAPAGKAYPAGTGVRQHRAWTQQNFVQSAGISPDWKAFSGECGGFSDGPPESRKWWPGAKAFSVILLANLKDGDAIRFRDVRLEKEAWTEAR